MNKRPASRRTELENELTGKITDQASLVETGKDEKKDDAYSRTVERRNHLFNIQQGHRRRHPQRVLERYNAINDTTESAETTWEKALMHEDNRIDLPEVYKPSDHEMVANQMGLVSAALDNYAKSKGKFTRSQVVGV